MVQNGDAASAANLDDWKSPRSILRVELKRNNSDSNILTNKNKQSPGGQWKCHLCFHVNSKDPTACTVCGTLKKSTNATKDIEVRNNTIQQDSEGANEEEADVRTTQSSSFQNVNDEPSCRHQSLAESMDSHVFEQATESRESLQNTVHKLSRRIEQLGGDLEESTVETEVQHNNSNTQQQQFPFRDSPIKKSIKDDSFFILSSQFSNDQDHPPLLFTRSDEMSLELINATSTDPGNTHQQFSLQNDFSMDREIPSSLSPRKLSVDTKDLEESSQNYVFENQNTSESPLFSSSKSNLWMFRISILAFTLLALVLSVLFIRQ